MQDDPGISAISTGGVQISCIPLFDAVGYNTSPPSAGNGVVYGEGDDGGVGAVDATTGSVLWSTTNMNLGDGNTPTLGANGGSGLRRWIWKRRPATPLQVECLQWGCYLVPQPG